jgi:hypothetical protein
MSINYHGNKLISTNDIDSLIMNNYDHIKKVKCFGETTYFYNKDNKKKRGVYFATIKNYDGPNDKDSNLDRKNIYRLSFKILDNEYIELFDKIHKKTSSINKFNFTNLNIIAPHPVYFYMKWIQILNPKYNNYQNIKTYLDNRYDTIKE